MYKGYNISFSYISINIERESTQFYDALETHLAISVVLLKNTSILWHTYYSLTYEEEKQDKLSYLHFYARGWLSNVYTTLRIYNLFQHQSVHMKGPFLI